MTYWHKYKKSSPRYIASEKAGAQLRNHIYTKARPNGRIIRPSRCALCKHEGFVEAHHIDYAQWQIVSWLCHPCHRKVDHGSAVLKPRHISDYTSLLAPIRRGKSKKAVAAEPLLFITAGPDISDGDDDEEAEYHPLSGWQDYEDIPF